MLSVTCEAYAFLRNNMAFNNEEIASIFKSWTSSGELKDTYLLQIGSEALRSVMQPYPGDSDMNKFARFKQGDSIRDARGIVDDIDDKVTQDVDNSEGTGVWTMKVNNFD